MSAVYIYTDRDPTVNDDQDTVINNIRVFKGLRWVNNSTHAEWRCDDPSSGAADWRNVSTATGTDDQTAAEVPFTPAGDLSSMDVQAALEELDTEKSSGGHTHTQSDITDLNHTDSDAIHQSVSGEIAGLTQKVSPVAGDYLVVEDSENANAKRYVLISDLPGTDDQVAAEVPFTPAGDLAATDVQAGLEELDTEKASVSHTHTEADITDLDHTDPDAIHSNVSSEISALTEKAAPVGTDYLIIEDSESGNAKRRVPWSSLPDSGTGTDDQTASEVPFSPNGDIAATDTQAAVVEVRDDTDVKLTSKSDTGHTHTEADITDLDHTDTDAFHQSVSGEVSGLTQKTTPVSGDYLIIEDSASGNAKRYVLVGDLPGSDDQTATEVPFSPDGDIAATDTQAAVVEVRDDTDTKLAGKSDVGHIHPSSDITYVVLNTTTSDGVIITHLSPSGIETADEVRVDAGVDSTIAGIETNVDVEEKLFHNVSPTNTLFFEHGNGSASGPLDLRDGKDMVLYPGGTARFRLESGGGWYLIGDHIAAEVPFTPDGDIESTYTQAAVVEVRNYTTRMQLANWESESTSSPNDLIALASNGVDVVAVGHNGQVAVADRAAIWDDLSTPVSDHLWDINVAAGDFLGSFNRRWIAVGNNGRIMYTQDDPRTSRSSSTGVTTENLWSVVFDKDNNEWVIVGDNGTFIHWVDDGSQPAWTVGGGPSTSLNLVDAIWTGTSWLVYGGTTSDQRVWRGQIGGTWTEELTLSGSDVNTYSGFAISDDGTIVLGAGSATQNIQRSIDDGQNWTGVFSGDDDDLHVTRPVWTPTHGFVARARRALLDDLRTTILRSVDGSASTWEQYALPITASSKRIAWVLDSHLAYVYQDVYYHSLKI